MGKVCSVCFNKVLVEARRSEFITICVKRERTLEVQLHCDIFIL